ncbi:MAG TPA: 2Fe-2S iron-sulfur cluster-binding protein [Candidatus Udaeobacter sp.]|jgi:aerobic-type carbon monoxide dehydrogenase small subunit (CoxS/CutS family)
MNDAIPVTLTVNGKKYDLRIDPRTTLLDCLREHLRLTGSKKGCDHGQCGACTVHINGRRVNSCLTFVAMHQGEEITTIEGIGQPENLHAMQAAFVERDAYQCGYCTSGQIMSAVALLKEPCGAELQQRVRRLLRLFFKNPVTRIWQNNDRWIVCHEFCLFAQFLAQGLFAADRQHRQR